MAGAAFLLALIFAVVVALLKVFLKLGYMGYLYFGARKFDKLKDESFKEIAELIQQEKYENAIPLLKGAIDFVSGVDKSKNEQEILSFVECLPNDTALIDFSEPDGATLLHVASASEFNEVVKLLISKGADVNRAVAETGITPLIIACARHYFKTVQLLLEANADINVTDNEGDTPLSVAEKNKHSHIVKLLRHFSETGNVTLPATQDEKPQPKTNCTVCGATILETTAARTGGRCMPCSRR